MPTSAQILAVRADADLRERLVALASLDPGITSATSWVDAHLERIAAAPLGSSGTDTIASVLEFTRVKHQPFSDDPTVNRRPGEDPAGVTDDHIRTAITTVLDQTPEG